MMRFTFRKGLRFLEGQRSWTLLRKLPTHKFQLEDEAGLIVQLTHGEIFELWNSKTWVVDESCLGDNSNIFYLSTPRDLTTFSEISQRSARRRLDLIQRATKTRERARDVAEESTGEVAVNTDESDDPERIPHRTTLYRWRARYAAGRDIVSLVDRRSRSGRKRDRVIYSFFEDALNAVYLSQQKFPRVAVYDEVRLQITKVNKSRPPENQLRPPGRTTIFNWLVELDAYLVDVARLGKPAADRKHRPAIGSAPAESIMQRIEIDHTPLDVMALDKKTMACAGRPWMTYARCRSSGAILGFYISFKTPSAMSVLRCLKDALCPKTDLLRRYPDIKGEWPMHGFPYSVVCDNGMELHAGAVEAWCLDYGILLSYCVAKDPGMKGGIERSFRTINDDLIHKLPGTTFSNPTERGDYEAEQNALLDIDDLRHLVAKWIVEVYHNRPHRETRESPLNSWNRQLKTTLIEYPVNPNAVSLSIGEVADRTLFHYGIEFEGLQYNNHALQTIKQRTSDPQRIRFKYFDEGVSFVQVWDDMQEEYVRVEVRPKYAEYAKDLNRDTHRAIRAHLRRQQKENHTELDLIQAKREIYDMVDALNREKKMRLRKLGHVMTGINSDQLLPEPGALEQALVKKPRLSIKPPEALDAGLEDQLPEFEFL